MGLNLRTIKCSCADVALQLDGATIVVPVSFEMFLRTKSGLILATINFATKGDAAAIPVLLTHLVFEHCLASVTSEI